MIAAIALMIGAIYSIIFYNLIDALSCMSRTSDNYFRPVYHQFCLKDIIYHLPSTEEYNNVINAKLFA